MLIKSKLLFSVIFNVLLVASSAVIAQSEVLEEWVVGEDSEMAVSSSTVLDAFSDIGLDVSQYRDSGGDPHFVVTTTVADHTSTIALFMDDCGVIGCEDLTFYAYFPPSPGITDAILNEWNHINAKLRSKAARSSNGEITISMTVSFLSDNDKDKLAMLAGLFVAEVNVMAGTSLLNSEN